MLIVKICFSYISKEVRFEFLDEKSGKSIKEQSYNNIKVVEIHGITRIFLEKIASDNKVTCIFAEAKGITINKDSMVVVE